MRENTNNEECTLLERATPAGAGLWTRKRTAAWVDVSLLWLWRASRNPELGFPKPIRLGAGPRSPVRYIAAEVEAWVRERQLAGTEK